jgi:hypothetical protein
MVWRARSRLQGTPIHLEEDQPAEIEARRYRLMPVYNQAMSMQAYRERTFINGDKLTINGVHYTVDTMDTLPGDLDPRYLATKTEGHCTIFFSINSPLSNHHPAKMIVENKKYLCNEQFYFAKRAEIMGDQTIQNRVMELDNPRDMLREGRKAKNLNDVNLEQEEIRIMKWGIREKFSQNQKLKDFLMETTGNKIGESSKASRRWGTGFHLSHKNAFNQNLWATNTLGEMLEEQRELFNS